MLSGCTLDTSCYDFHYQNYEVFPNGTAKTEGKISIQQEGYNFDYKLISKGNWYLDGWYIIEQLTSASVKPNFTPQLKAAMKKILN